MGFFDVPPPEPGESEQRDTDPDGGRWMLGTLVVDQFVGWSEHAAVAVRDICMLPDSFDVEGHGLAAAATTRPRSARHPWRFRAVGLPSPNTR
jgi:hypothetical protein